MQSELRKIGLDGTDAHYRKDLDQVRAGMQELGAMRQRVAGREVTTGEMLELQTALNGSVLDSIQAAGAFGTDPDVSEQSAAYVAFAKCKDRAGVEGAVLADTFARDVFGDGLYTEFQHTVEAQRVYAHEFAPQASADVRDLYDDKVSGG